MQLHPESAVGIIHSDGYDASLHKVFRWQRPSASRWRSSVLIIDDVISAGTSVRESVEIIKANNATRAGGAIALDRQERGTGSQSAIQEVQASLHVPVVNIVDLDALIKYLSELPPVATSVAAIQAYHLQYGSLN